MNEYYRNFRQSKFTHWLWLAVIIMAAVLTLIALVNAQWAHAFDQAIFGIFVYKVDQLEKYITHVNNTRDKT